VEYVAGSKHGLGRCYRSSSTSRSAAYVSCAVPAVEEVGCAVPQVEQVEQVEQLRGVCVLRDQGRDGAARHRSCVGGQPRNAGPPRKTRMTRVIRRCDTTPFCVAVDVGRAEPLAGCCLWGWFVGKSRGSCGDDLLGV